MNFRRIFEERHYDIKGRVLSLADTQLFRDVPGGFSVSDQNRADMIERAEALLDKEYPSLLATDFMWYRRTGDRRRFESKYHPRRSGLVTLTLAESFERKGRFTDAIVNLLWMILEETTWVLPAHNRSRPGTVCPLSYAFGETVDYIDLCAASTAADVAFSYYLLKDELDGVTPLIRERILYELNRRIIRPYLDQDNLRATLWWSAVNGGTINNWNPWIISNILTTAVLVTEDMAQREAIVDQSMRLLDNFTAGYHDDGGCDEGPDYWEEGCGALFDSCCLFYDVTAGYVDMFDDPLLKSIGEYKPAMYITNGKFLNFADANTKSNPDADLVLLWGQKVGSETMISYGSYFLNGNAPKLRSSSMSMYRSLRMSCMQPVPPIPFHAPKKAYLNGLQIAVTRDTEDTDTTLYLAAKGGHNAESHNHCDVGQIIVFNGNTPIFIDAGHGTYTKRYFGPERYTIWHMCSDYHNTVTVNNCMQLASKDACAKDVVYDEATGKLSMNLTDVYPKEANLASYVRSAVLTEGTVTLTDTVAFDGEGVADFHFMTAEPPTDVQKGSLRLRGCTVTFAEDLTVEVEECDHTLPETERIPQSWDTDALYRITLHAAPFTCRTFTLTVQK